MRCKNCDNDGGLKGNRHIRNRRYTCSNYRGGSDVEIDFSTFSYDSSDYSSNYSSDYSGYSSDTYSSSSDSGYSSSE